MPTRTEYVDAALFMTHKGVEIYHTYRDNDVDQGPRDGEFSWKPNADIHTEGDTFCVGDLPIPDGCSLDDHPRYLSGIAKDSDEYRELEAEWKHWHEVEEPRRVKAIVMAAIDSGLLTQDGLRLPESATDEERAEAIRKLAKTRYHRDGVLEVEDGATVSEGEDNGAYVEAWIWVDFAGTPLSKT